MIIIRITDLFFTSENAMLQEKFVSRINNLRNWRFNRIASGRWNYSLACTSYIWKWNQSKTGWYYQRRYFSSSWEGAKYMLRYIGRKSQFDRNADTSSRTATEAWKIARGRFAVRIWIFVTCRTSVNYITSTENKHKCFGIAYNFDRKSTNIRKQIIIRLSKII